MSDTARVDLYTYLDACLDVLASSDMEILIVFYRLSDPQVIYVRKFMAGKSGQIIGLYSYSRDTQKDYEWSLRKRSYDLRSVSWKYSGGRRTLNLEVTHVGEEDEE